jgi:hypothetical protein
MNIRTDVVAPSLAKPRDAEQPPAGVTILPRMYGIFLIVLKVLADALTATSGIYGLLREFKDEHHNITKAGKIALGGIVIGFVLSGGIAYLEARKAAQDDENHRIELARQHSEDQAKIAKLQETIDTGNEMLKHLVLTLQPATVRQSPDGAYFVDLSWNPSSTAIVSGYNIYRSTMSGGPLVKLNSQLILSLSYRDKTVTAGSTYYYTATAIDSDGRESARSNEKRAAIPTPNNG